VAESVLLMSNHSSLILKDNLELQNELKVLKIFLSEAIKLKFWRLHFKNQQFKLNLKNFDLDYWKSLPLVTKADFLKIGLNNRLSDAQRSIRNNTGHFILQPTSGTSQLLEPTLFIKNVDNLVDGKSHNKGEGILILYQGCAISLRDVIAVISRSRKEKRNIQSLVVNPFRFEEKMIPPVNELNMDTIVTFPSCINHLASLYPSSKSFFSKIKTLFFSGDFLSPKQQTYINKKLPRAEIDIDYIMTEVDTIGICCPYLKKSSGINAYHPFSDRLVELINLDEYGRGDVVVSKIAPLSLSYIRYKTGDVGRAVYKKCKCGNKWTILLEGRSNMDYIKSHGVLITRTGIENILSQFSRSVEEWRGEVREIEHKDRLLGELTLLIKPLQKLNPGDIKTLAKTLSRKLFLTPKKTLEELILEDKFMPLKIKIVQTFPITAKRILLRKVID
jgi:hypothetical protein